MTMQDPATGQEQEQETVGGESIADLRAAADKGRKLERENIMLRAGVDFDSPLGKMFATSGYDGPLDLDAVRASWAEIAPATQPPAQQGQGDEPPPAAEPMTQPSQLDAQRQQDEMRRGIGSTPSPPPEPIVGDRLKEGFDRFHQDLTGGVGRERAAKAVVDAVVVGAIEGDQRFVWDGWTPEELAKGQTSRT